ncbi:sugar phosphate isomerase/epimerase family protein [Halobaculum sp. MBLA0147]|uniref:sugar phosphate isomerase/epimerase family protein n=1 Tax=Halobaculum sp. MBLA0147 TaxID=3079934 RepID=UPI003523B17A
MDVGVLTVPLGESSRREAFEYLGGLGVDTVELGVGGHPGEAHADRERLLAEPAAREELRDDLAAHDLSVSALATHDNPLHPDEERAARADRHLREAIELAGDLGVGTVTCFSGLPAGGPEDTVPNWITAPWPPEHAEALEYQWSVAEAYWTDLADHAAAHGVDVAIEMHPNMLVYEPHGLVELREVTNERIGANLDPSHLYWQGIDVVAAIRLLGEADAIHHVHAKDTQVVDEVAREKGVLDTTDYGAASERSWLFRTVGYGHDEGHWRDVVSALRLAGYDGALSIEHEDALTSSREGLEKAVAFLQRVTFETQPGETFWTE